MGKRRKKHSTPLTWKAIREGFRLLLEGVFKASPVLIMGGIGFAIFWGIRENLYADPGFLVQTVEVLPPKSLSHNRIAELEKIYLHQNLFRISPREVAKRVEQDPQIRETRVMRDFPKTLRIEVIDRSALGQIQLSPDGPYYTLAEDGVILSGESARNKQFVLVEILDAGLPRLERGRRYLFPGLKQAVALMGAFRSHSLGRSEIIERIRLDHLGNVSVFLAQGPELRFGRDPLKKLYALDSLEPLLKGTERKQIVYIELQYQDLIVRKK